MDPNLQKILVQIERFGFKFYGYDENRAPLVIGPNNQVVEVNVAINFVNQQIEAQRNSSNSGNMEMPQMTNSPDTASKFESGSESNLEKGLEKPKEEPKQQTQAQPQMEVNVAQKAPSIKLSRPTIKPYGDGFDPKTFNPEDIKSTIKFIEKNSSASRTSSNKWLSEQFRKFLKEIKSGKV